MKRKNGYLRSVVVILAATIFTVLTGCTLKSTGLTGVKSITLEQQLIEIEGHKETITVMPDGFLHRELSTLDGVTAEKSVISPDDFAELVEILEKNRFIQLPDDLSTESADGAILTITVETETDIYRKGGLNPNNPDFMNCFDGGIELLQ